MYKRQRNLEGFNDEDVFFNWFFWDAEWSRQGLIRDGGVTDGAYLLQVNRMGFRDAKVWPPLMREGDLPIVLGAAGHGFGENISEGKIYPHLLENELQELTQKKVKLYNLSVQGSTVLFFERYLLAQVLAMKPHAVVLSYGGFNEALYSPIPEREVLLPTNVLHNALMGSVLFRQIRLLGAARSRKTNRVTVDEMVQSYHRIITSLKQENISIVLLQQIVNHPDIEGLWRLSEMKKYRQAMRELSISKQLPLADPCLLYTSPSPRD